MKFIKDLGKFCKLIKDEHHKHVDGQIQIDIDWYLDEMHIIIPAYVLDKIDKTFTIKAGEKFLNNYWKEGIRNLRKKYIRQ